MQTTDSSQKTVKAQPTIRVAVPPNRGGSATEPASWRFVVGAAVGVGIISFLVTELLRYLLVPDIGRTRERLLAELLTAVIVGCLTAKLLQITRERHRLTVARMQVIVEMNHHIRNALSPISLSLDETENQQLKNVISPPSTASTGRCERSCPARPRCATSSDINWDIFSGIRRAGLRTLQ